MSGKNSSSLGTLLFSVPLAAIPLMAIFGIPQFAPLVASPERTSGYDRAEDRGGERRGRSERRRDEDFAEETDDLDAPAFDSGRRSSGGRGVSERYGRSTEDAPKHDARPRDTWPESGEDRPEVDLGTGTDLDTGRSRPRTMAGQSETRTTPFEAAGSSGLTWRMAAERLQDLGITNYHLEQGSEALTFLFVCSFCPAATPNVEMRFESEASEPLDAVDDVLAQIGQWQARQPGGQQ